VVGSPGRFALADVDRACYVFVSCSFTAELYTGVCQMAFSFLGCIECRLLLPKFLSVCLAALLGFGVQKQLNGLS